MRPYEKRRPPLGRSVGETTKQPLTTVHFKERVAEKEDGQKGRERTISVKENNALAPQLESSSMSGDHLVQIGVGGRQENDKAQEDIPTQELEKNTRFDEEDTRNPNSKAKFNEAGIVMINEGSENGSKLMLEEGELLDVELNFRDIPALKNSIPRRSDLEELSSSMMVGRHSRSSSPRAGTSPRTVGEVSM